jgi:hypothetical protein
MVQQTFTFKPDVKQQREALDLVPDMTVEALGPWIEGCGEEMLTWEGMGPAPAGGYRDILGNPSKKNLISRSLLSSHIRSRVKLASGFFNGLRPNACRASVFEATRAGLAMLRLKLDPADGGATDITGIDQPLVAEIVRNAALLVATPSPEQFQMEKLVSRLVNYEQHFQFNYKPVNGKRRTMQLDFSEKDEDIVQLVLLEDLGLVRDTELMRTTHQELWAWCDNPRKYKQKQNRTKQKKCEDCGLKQPSCGLPTEGKRWWCGGCAKGHVGAADLVSKKCEDCGLKQASCGLPSEWKRRWCGGCAKGHAGVARGRR